jgi:hypothetical protein
VPARRSRQYWDRRGCLSARVRYVGQGVGPVAQQAHHMHIAATFCTRVSLYRDGETSGGIATCVSHSPIGGLQATCVCTCNHVTTVVFPAHAACTALTWCPAGLSHHWQWWDIM